MAFTASRKRAGRPSATDVTHQEDNLRKLYLIKQEASKFDNKMLADMYIYACEQQIVHNNSKFMEFMGELDQTPVSIETFLDSKDFIGGTDLKLWPAVRVSLLEMHRDWYKGKQGGAYTEAVFAGSTSNAKCLGKDTPIVMYDGTTRYSQDIEVGDKVMGVDSTPREVLSVSSGRETMYRITPIQGDTFECNESHILSLKKTGTVSHGSLKPKGEIVNISVKDYLQTTKTFKHTHKLWHTGVEMLKAPTACDPYIVGLYLSDGNKRTPRIYNHEDDIEIHKYIHGWGSKVGLKITLSREKSEHGVRLAISGYTGKVGSNWFIPFIKTLLTEDSERYIPQEYLSNDRASRLQLLAGICDADGSLNNVHNGSRTGYIVICKDKCYAKQVQYLARSLGLTCKLTQMVGKIKSLGFEGVYYRLTIGGCTDVIPCKLPRKQSIKAPRRKDPLVSGFSIGNIGIGNYYGLTIGGDHLFLLGDFTVTHNTTQAIISFLYFAHILGCLKNPQKVYDLPSSTGIVLAIFAAKPTVMKRAVYMPLRGLMEQVNWYKQYMPWDESLKSEIYFFKQNMRIIPAGLDADSVIGEAVVGVIIDEANFFPVVKQSKKILALESNAGGGRTSEYDTVQILYDTVNRRRDSRFAFMGQQVGMIIVSSSKKYVGDFTDRRIEHVRNYELSDVYIYDKQQPEVVPADRFCGKKFKISVSSETNGGLIIHEDIDDTIPTGSREYVLPIEYLDKFRSDPNGSLRDVLGLASTAISPFFSNRLKILQTVERSEKSGLESFLQQDNVNLGTYGLPIVKEGHVCRDPHMPRFVHVDLSSTGDFCGIAMVHHGGMTVKERAGDVQEILPITIADMVCSIEPDHANPIDIADVRAWIKTLKTQYRYPINTVTYDTYQSQESIQAWRKMGVKSGNVTVDRDTKAYKSFREMLYDDRVNIYDNTVLIEEMMTIEYDIAKDKVDHSFSGHKDLIDALVGASYMLSRSPASWVGVINDSDSVSDELRTDMGDRQYSEHSQRR